MNGPRIVVALDYPTAEEALAFADRVTPDQCRLKVGLEMFSASGPSFVTRLVDQGFDVFLDLKFHDIPTTVARACLQAARLGVWMVNVHTLGGRQMLEAAREAVDHAIRRPPLLVGVTLLTSQTATDMAEIGLTGDVRAQVRRLTSLAHAAGLDGVVCSAQEAGDLRKQFGENFTLVTPGIRPVGTPVQDQQRSMTPAEAVNQGADYLVIGRPITRARDPVNTLHEICQQIPDG